MLRFKYGSLEKFKSLEEKDPDVLYFLDNHTIYKGEDLLSVVKTADDEFPEQPTDDMKETYFISLSTGKIKYVTDDLNYVDITRLQINNMLIDEEFVNGLLNTLAKYTEEVTMPDLTVDKHTLIWKNSNKQKIQIINFNG